MALRDVQLLSTRKAILTLYQLPKTGDDAMAFQAVPDVAEIVVKYSGNSRDAVNVFHASKAGGYNLADLVSLATAVDAAITANWLPIQSQDFLYISTTVRGLAVINDQEVIDTTGSANGGILLKALPGNVTFSVKRESQFTGRSARGRLYWIALPAQDLQANENLLLQAAATAIVAAVEAMRVAITATAWTAAIVSRFTGGLQRPTGVFFEWRDTSSVNINVDSQRRRLIS